MSLMTERLGSLLDYSYITNMTLSDREGQICDENLLYLRTVLESGPGEHQEELSICRLLPDA